MKRVTKQLLRHVARATGDDRAQQQQQQQQQQQRADPEVRASQHDPDYWFAHCHGFLVDTLSGEEVGVVDDVAIDPSSGLAAAIEIKAGWFGRRRFSVPAHDVKRILPAERRLYIDRQPRAARPRRSRHSRRG